MSRFIFVGFRYERRRIFNQLRKAPQEPEPEVPKACSEVHAFIVGLPYLFSRRKFTLPIFLTHTGSDRLRSVTGNTGGYRPSTPVCPA
jgi:hypothetical protein